jgi:hypothetical protein
MADDFMACPARFERATYALEALKMSRNNKLDNGFNLLTFGVQSAPRTLVQGGIAWISVGIRRRSKGRMSNLSG